MSICTPGYGATSYVDASRGGSTLAWTSPGNAAIGSPTATDPGFLPGLSSHWLAGTGFVPVPSIPSDATLSSLTLYVRHRRTYTGAPCAVVLSAVHAGSSDFAPAHAVPDAFEDYAVDLTSLAPTIAALNAGIDAKIAYDAVPNDSRYYDAANWTVVVSPSSTQNYRNLGTLTHTQAFTVTATWSPSTLPVGTPAPPFVPLSIHGVAQGQGDGHDTGSFHYPTGYYGTASVDNGLGTVASGDIGSTPLAPEDGGTGGEIPLYERAESTKKINAPVSGGVGTLTVTMSGSVSVSGDYPQDGTLAFSASASVATPDACTVEVESMYLVACYDGSAPPPTTLVPIPPELSRIPPLRPETPTIR